MRCCYDRSKCLKEKKKAFCEAWQLLITLLIAFFLKSLCDHLKVIRDSVGQNPEHLQEVSPMEQKFKNNIQAHL